MSSYIIEKDAYHLVSIALIIIGCAFIHYFMTQHHQQQKSFATDKHESTEVDTKTGK